MASNKVDQESLGAWLIKSSPDSSTRVGWLATAFGDVTTRCVRKTYRTDLVAAGQPVLLWFSGQDPDHPAGIYAQGWTTGVASSDEDDVLVMPVALEPVEPPVLRHEILVHPALSRIEVVRMPAGSNPSFLSKAQLAELRQTWPQVTVDEIRAARSPSEASPRPPTARPDRRALARARSLRLAARRSAR